MREINCIVGAKITTSQAKQTNDLCPALVNLITDEREPSVT